MQIHWEFRLIENSFFPQPGWSTRGLCFLLESWFRTQEVLVWPWPQHFWIGVTFKNDWARSESWEWSPWPNRGSHFLQETLLTPEKPVPLYFKNRNEVPRHFDQKWFTHRESSHFWTRPRSNAEPIIGNESKSTLHSANTAKRTYRSWCQSAESIN